MAISLYLDLETRSTIDLRKVGIYIYADHQTTDVIMACWAIDEGPVHTWYPGEDIPPELFKALTSGCRVVAHNATFERILYRHVLGPRYSWPDIADEQWDCTMARARAMGLPGALDGALQAMGAPLQMQKDRQGHNLMLRMCRPRSIAADGTPVWWIDKDKISRLTTYCAQDVQGKRWLDRRLPALSEFERAAWRADQRMNDRGLPIDQEFLGRAVPVSREASAALDKEMHAITQGAVPKATNVTRLVHWLILQGVEVQPWEADEEEVPAEDADTEDDNQKVTPALRKDDVARLLTDDMIEGPERRALEIRQEAGKTSVKKLETMLHRISSDGRIRGNLNYCGAHTGRWSATGGIQFQNLPRDGVKDWDSCFASLALGAETVAIVEGPPLDIISRMLRGSILAPPGNDLCYGDLSSVEARGLAWLAGQNDLVEAFRQGAKIYEEMAASVFGVPLESIARDSFERFVGKGLVLGAGFQMGGPRFAKQCARAGKLVSLELAEAGIDGYRARFPRIKDLWYELERCAIAAVEHPGTIQVAAGGRIKFAMFKKWLQMELPSGRKISYRNPRIGEGKFGRDALFYDGINPVTKKWGEQSTYGGRLTENAVQGMCRDLIACSMLALERAGYLPILLVHDEIITVQPVGHGSMDEMNTLMTTRPPWARGFPLAAEGRRSQRYSK